MNNIFSAPVYAMHEIPYPVADRDSILLISHKLAGTWQIINLTDGAIHTPQSFEATFGFLPPCPPSATAKTRKKYYAHRHKNPVNGRRGRGQGFG